MPRSMQHLKDMKTLLVKHGFYKKSAKGYSLNDKGFHVGPDGNVNPQDADVEVAEVVNVSRTSTAYMETGYPKPHKVYKIVFESHKSNIEEPYYWILDHMRQDMGYPYVDKITDMFSSSEQSAFWGAAQSRVGIQQDRASQYLRGISEMIKQLFQLVRELRVLDEKLEPRKNWGKIDAADLALKGEYTDLVENRGGQIQPGSIYHLSQSVGYAILPDLFFNTHVYTVEDVDKKIDAMKFNTNVKNVLKRKMYAFVNWKLKTDEELKNRRTFTLRYLRQHWNTIKMYMNWVKPYLKNIARMQMNPTIVDSPDIVGSFESSVIELEVLGYKESQTTHHPCILASFSFRTRPELSFQQDQYQHKGPIHVGRVEITMRAYGWTLEQIESYKKMRREEDMMLLGLVDESIKAAMDALGEELERYLSEAGEAEFEQKRKEKEAQEKKKEKEAVARSENMLEPFTAIYKGFAEMVSLINPVSLGPKKQVGKPKGGGKEQEEAAGGMWQIYKNFKKAHGLLSW